MEFSIIYNDAGNPLYLVKNGVRFMEGDKDFAKLLAESGLSWTKHPAPSQMDKWRAREASALDPDLLLAIQVLKAIPESWKNDGNNQHAISWSTARVLKELRNL